MWYLQTDTLFIIAAMSLAFALLRKLKDKRFSGLPMGIIMPVVQLAVLCYVGVGLAVFYALYTALGLLLARLLEKPHKPWVFALLCVLEAVPLFISRADILGIELPFLSIFVGIAFNMLKAIDVLFYVHYSGERIDAETYVNYMLFIPVFTSGPIFRYRDFKRAWAKPLPLTGVEFTSDAMRIIKGLFKKVVLLALVIQLQTWLVGLGEHFYVSFALVVVSYVMLYLDLSGYTDIAIGFGRICGLNVPENFKEPWKAPTFTQFWRSWHATLSDWIREHIYVIVADKKLGRGKAAALALLTMVIMALWHGFRLDYLLVCGFYLGGLLALENLFGLTTCSRRKTSAFKFYVRCFIVNFLFAVNTLVFTLPEGGILSVLRGFVSL